jgi:hypothetical protein
MPGDAVEERPQHLRRVQALLHHRLIQQQLHQNQLVDRHARDARQQALEPLIELFRWRRLDRQPPLLRFPTRQAIAGQQQALGLFQPDAMKPQRSRRRTPDPRRRITDLGVVGDHQQVRAQRHVGAAGHAVAMDLAHHRFLAVKQTHETAHVAAHHGVVDGRVPGGVRHVILHLHARIERRACRSRRVGFADLQRLGAFDQIVAAAETRAVSG